VADEQVVAVQDTEQSGRSDHGPTSAIVGDADPQPREAAHGSDLRAAVAAKLRECRALVPEICNHIGAQIVHRQQECPIRTQRQAWQQVSISGILVHKTK